MHNVCWEVSVSVVWSLLPVPLSNGTKRKSKVANQGGYPGKGASVAVLFALHHFTLLASGVYK